MNNRIDTPTSLADAVEVTEQLLDQYCIEIHNLRFSGNNQEADKASQKYELIKQANQILKQAQGIT